MCAQTVEVDQMPRHVRDLRFAIVRRQDDESEPRRATDCPDSDEPAYIRIAVQRDQRADGEAGEIRAAPEPDAVPRRDAEGPDGPGRDAEGPDGNPEPQLLRRSARLAQQRSQCTLCE